MPRLPILLALALCAASTSARAQPPGAGGPFRVGTAAALPGALATGVIDVAPRGDEGARLPVTVLRGARPGPVVALIAGVHGSEFSPILALNRFARRVTPATFGGTLVMVHAANPPAFFGRTVYTGPVDGKNLNRSFPGKADGTLTERIAHALVAEVLTPADVVVDIHSGDANEDLTPWVGFYARHGTPAVIARSRELAVATGFGLVVHFPQAPVSVAESLYTGAAAVALGKAAFDFESGGRGLVDEAAVEAIENGLVRVLQHLGMLPGTPAAAPEPVHIEERQGVRADADGVFWPMASAGRYVAKGTLLGEVRDFHGALVQEVRAPAAGIVLVILSSPPVKAGETIATIAIPVRSQDR